MKKTLRRIFAAVLAALLLAALLAGTAGAAGAAGTRFPDVPWNAYYADAVAEMSAAGAVNGYTDGTFRPAGFVTNAEALKLVCSLAGVACGGYTRVRNPWYSDVVTWAQVNGVAPADLNPTAAATREQLCAYIARVYRLDTTKTTSNAFADTTSAVANTLRDAGVVAGIPQKNGTVIFGGGQKVRRCDACVLLQRLSARLTPPDWSAQTAYSLDLSHYAVAQPGTVTTFSELVSAIGYAYLHAPCRVTIRFRPVSTVNHLAATLSGAADFARLEYYDYASIVRGVSFTMTAGRIPKGSSSAVVIEMSEKSDSETGLSDAEKRQRLREFELTCRRQVAGLYESGALRSDMSARERADVLCGFVHRELTYDDSLRSHDAWSAAVRKTAVCEGYSGYYMCLCNLAGVPARCMTDLRGINHAWTQLWSDGAWYNVDATFCDQDSDWGYSTMHDAYFWKTDAELQDSDRSYYTAVRQFDLDAMTPAFS